MPLLPIAMALAQFAPMIAGMLGGEKAEAVAGKVVDIAQTVTGAASPGDALHVIRQNPELAMAFQTKVVESHVEFAKIEADVEKARIAAQGENMASVNKTMQAEASASHWPTYSWRPSIGFAMAFNLVAGALIVVGVFLAQVFNADGASAAVAALPAALGALTALNAMAAPVLGIASYWRGKMQASPDVPSDNRG